MSILIIAVLIGLGFGYFATQNTIGVTVNIAQYSWSSVPLYIVAVGSLLVGLFAAWILSLVDWAASFFAISNRDHQIKKDSRAIEELSHKVKSLEVENARLRGREGTDPIVIDPSKKSFLDRFRRHQFST